MRQKEVSKGGQKEVISGPNIVVSLLFVVEIGGLLRLGNLISFWFK